MNKTWRNFTVYNDTEFLRIYNHERDYQFLAWTYIFYILSGIVTKTAFEITGESTVA
jgi:hypothetical protein